MPSSFGMCECVEGDGGACWCVSVKAAMTDLLAAHGGAWQSFWA